MKIVTIVGARPQFIKLAPISFEISTRKNLNEEIIHTGQHFDPLMSEIFFEQMSIPKPKFNLNIGGGTHGSNTGRMLEEIEKILLRMRPDITVIYGDTDSTLAGALASSKLHIPVIHIEAGLRSFNRKMPEELNRVVADHLSDVCFSPSDNAVQNLLNEGIKVSRIIRTDDIMIDAARIFSENSQKNSTIIKKLNLLNKDFVLATIHRAENTDSEENLTSILKALSVFALSTAKVVLPLHPRTKKAIEDFSLGKYLRNIICIDPVGYLDMIQLEKLASLIVTDSGGIQKEAYFYRTQCVTLRKETEWIELVEAGCNVLVEPNDTDSILKEINFNFNNFKKNTKHGIYGNGYASKYIVDKLVNTYSFS